MLPSLQSSGTLWGICTPVMNMTYSGMWIGRDGRIAWPPWSPELNVIDFFFHVTITELGNVYVLHLHSTFPGET